MVAYLKIENPGAAPEESFTLLGASTKRKSNNSATIGSFGTGNKQGIGVLLRHSVAPIIFAGQLKMEFGTRSQNVHDGIQRHEFNRIFVKFGGRDRSGKNRSSNEDLGFVLEHGSADWNTVDLGLREFVSNAIDRAVEEGENNFLRKVLESSGTDFVKAVKENKNGPEALELKDKLKAYQKTAKDYQNVVVEIVADNQVRAKSDTTRIFVPLTNEVLDFYNNLNKWFLHFSEPELLDQTILPKKNRNLGDRKSAVIYRRGVRVREFHSSETPSLFDYNLENLKLDESRQVDDWYVQYEAAKAMANADVKYIATLWQSFIELKSYWEHQFSHGLQDGSHDTERRRVWTEAFELVAGTNSVVSTKNGGEQAARKGYKIVEVPESFSDAAINYGLKTPVKVLSEDERLGREIYDASPDAQKAVDYVWGLVTEHNLTNGRSKPVVKTFRKIMEAETQILGYYKNDTVFINQDIAEGLSHQLLVTALEEVVHHVTQATDNSRDFQDYLLNLIVHITK